MTTYVEKLEKWYQDRRATGELVDIKFFPTIETEDFVLMTEEELAAHIEAQAKAIYETVTNERDMVETTHERL